MLTTVCLLASVSAQAETARLPRFEDYPAKVYKGPPARYNVEHAVIKVRQPQNMLLAKPSPKARCALFIARRLSAPKSPLKLVSVSARDHDVLQARLKPAGRARSSTDRAPAFEAGGCRFDPCRARHVRTLKSGRQTCGPSEAARATEPGSNERRRARGGCRQFERSR